MSEQTHMYIVKRLAEHFIGRIKLFLNLLPLPFLLGGSFSLSGQTVEGK